MKKRIFAVILSLVMLLGTLPVTVGAVNLNSGSLSMPKLSKTEIKQLVKDCSREFVDYFIFDVDPSISAPYTIGKVKSDALQNAANNLNFVRRLAGLPAVTLDSSLCESAQYGAVILAALDDLSHTPTRPDGMDDSFYQQAYAATSRSNLSAGYTLSEAPFGFMEDSDDYNIDRVGHRRWQLNPSLGKVGFGYAVSYSPSTKFGRFVDERVFDKSGKGCDYNFISWPSSGYFPSDLREFSTYTAWSITLNPEKYQTQYQQLDNVVVTLTRQSDKKSWTFSNARTYPTGAAEYFNVDYGRYGIPNCIVFRPDMEADHFEGVYTVQVSGIKDQNGRDADFSYQVDFFTADENNTPTQEPDNNTPTQEPDNNTPTQEPDNNTPATSNKSGWQQFRDKWQYFKNGKPSTGWQQVDGTWYYFNNSGVMQTGWVSVDGVWYYLNSSGAMQTGWLNDGGTWYYLYDSGAMATGWLNDGAWYYLTGSGTMSTGWVSVDGTWYYMNSSGAMQTGWLNDGGTWYYLYDSGAMATGWLNDGAWYYLNGSGSMATGWVSVDGVWYYMNSSGVMQTGWVDDGGTWYYLDSNGAWTE